jgi:hypothetical protein
MKFPLALLALLFSSFPAPAAITPANLDFEDLTGTFPTGWTVEATTTAVSGLGSLTAASLASGAAIHQDFAAASGDGLTSFTSSFTWLIEGSGNLTTNSCRLRLRGHNNDASKNLITLRLSSAGLESFSNPSWATDVPFVPQLGTAYTITVEVGNLDADAELEYRLAISGGSTNATGPIRNSWHSGANTILANTTTGTPFETIRFEAGAGNTLIVDNVALPGFPPVPNNQLVLNPGFEVPPFASSWTNNGAITYAGLNTTSTAARLPFNTTATLEQTLVSSTANFTADSSFEIAGNNTEQAFRWQLAAGGSTAIDLRTTAGGVLQALINGTWNSLYRISDSSTFGIGANSTVRIRVIGRGFGSPNASYDIVWSDPGSATLSHAATGLTTFASANPPAAPLDAVRFTHDLLAGNSFTVDDVTVLDAAALPPAADHSLSPPPPPLTDKIVSISGVYPHLVMTNAHDECGVGAVVPWAGKLWAITYGPHLPNGSTDKLYEIAPDLSRVIRPESVGGTPANRFIHTASNQLNIGPYFIDSARNVRVLTPAAAPGRHTGTAAHLTDPNRLYLFTMEDGVYDVNATDLSFITRYPDRQGTGDRFLFGYHGKGAYTGQGRLVVANNGRPASQGTPTGPAGVLATWDGVTVAQNGGSYLATNDPNNSAEENTTNPVAAQPNYIAGWQQETKTQHCEVTGPGGIYGNPNPATDPVWSTGFDAKSVLLHVMENQQWQLWRLPKGSYSHDGSHGWHTEWPRIRQLDPTDPNSIYLMHMHGIFFNFPKTFSADNFAGLAPISNYYKMPTDYAVFNGKIVMGKNDASKFSNPLAQKNQSNFWFGTMDDIENWGSPAGHGAVWMNEAVGTGQTSDPFLIDGFANRTLHLRNNSGSPVAVMIQTSYGTNSWSDLRSINVPASGYAHEILNDVNAPWIRLQASAASSNLTAFFHLHSPYPHTTPASVASDEFAALADIRDTRSMSDGIIRVRNNTDLSLEFASSRTSSSGAVSSHRYHIIGGPMVLNDVSDTTAESAMRSTAATTKHFGGDDASVWIDSGGTRYRLPRLDPQYDQAFAAGWARGVREAVTERELLNCHGTFYEVPRANSGGYRKMRALATHGKRITDFASWRGLLVLTGVLDDAPASDKLVRNADGSAALWLGEIDDLWRMGEPRGTGGPWLNTAVTANTASDPFLMYGYDQKELTLSASDATTITVELDFLADNSWSVYQTFSLAAGETVVHTFPAGFHAHWVRVKSSAATTASAQFAYGPAEVRDRFLDWARDQGMATGSGRDALVSLDDDGDDIPLLIEFLVDGNTALFDPQPIKPGQSHAEFILRDLLPSDGITFSVEFSDNLTLWQTHPEYLAPSPDQSGVPGGFTRMRVTYPPGEDHLFFRLQAE